MVDFAQTAPQGGVITNAEAGVFIPENWRTDVIRYRQKEFAAARWVSTMPFSGGIGDTIRRPRIGRLGSHNKLPGMPVRYQSRKETEWLMRVRQYRESSFSLDNMTAIQTNVNLRAEYTVETGRALAEWTDNLILAERASFNGYSSANHITDSTPIKYEHMLAAWDVMKRRRYRQKDLAYLIGSAHYASLFADDRFIKSGIYNSGNIANIPSGAVVGSVLGVPVVMLDTITANSVDGWTNGDDGEPEPTPGMDGSPFMPTQSGTEDTKYTYTPSGLEEGYWTAMLVARSSIVMAVQKVPSVQGYYNIDFQEWRVVNTQIGDCKVLDPEGGVLISTDEDDAIA
jgi:hypothetical protein